MSSKKPIAILMAAAMTVASLSAVSLYADDVYDSNNKPQSSSNNGGEVFIADDNTTLAGQADETTENTEEAQSEATTENTTTTEEEITGNGNEILDPSTGYDFNDLPAGFIRGYLDMPTAPSSLKGESIKDFTDNMSCVSITGERLSGANNDLVLNISALVGDMKVINGRPKAYAMLYKFDKDSTITITSGYSLSTSDKNDGIEWKTANAPDDNYQYIVVWYNANIASTAIVFREEKIDSNNKKVVTQQRVTVIRRDTTPIDPSATTTSPETTAPENLISEVSTDWPIKATITDRRGTVDLDGYKLIIEPCSEVYLNSSRQMPGLVAAIKDSKAFVYDISLEKNGVARDFTSLFKVNMALPEKMKSVKDVYLYKASSGGYTSMDLAEIKSGEISFSTYDLGIRVIVSSVRLDGYTSETTTGTGTNGSGTASPAITGDSNAALSGAEVRVYSDATLPNGTKLQITALDSAQTNNKTVQVAISQGKALPFDISLVNNGSPISQASVKAISVKFNAPSQFSGVSPLYVYRLESDDTLTNMYAGVSGSVISFVTAHLSTYLISAVPLDGSAIITDGSGNVITNVTTTKKPNGGGSDVIINPGDKGDNVPTGFLLALVPVGLAAAGIVITIKKKR